MSHLNKIDVNKVCRTCLSCSKDMKSLFGASSTSAAISFAEMLMTCTPLTYNAYDGLSAQICHNCVQEVNKCYVFQLKCVDSDAILRNGIEKDDRVKIEMIHNDECSDSGIIKEVYVPGKPLNTPLTFTEMQTDLSQQLDLIKHEVDGGDVKIEIGSRRPKVYSDMDTDTDTYCSKQNSHSGEREERYLCTVCNNCFSMKSNLRAHMQTHSGAKKRSVCTLCNRSFKFKRSLTTHMRTHTGEKPYSCTLCDSRFTNKSLLTYHMQKHSGEKPFLCTLCDSAFFQNSHLTTHMRTHTGEKPYLCTICKFLFREKSNLIKHMQTHSDMKPYSCTLCTSSFKLKQYLTRHMRTHVREISYA